MVSIFEAMLVEYIEQSILIERNRNRPRIMKTGRYQGAQLPMPATIVYKRSVSKTFVNVYRRILRHIDQQNVIHCIVTELLREYENIYRYVEKQ